MSLKENHPSPEELEGAAFGWLPEERARAIRGHAMRCSTCSLLLAADDELRRQLSTLHQQELRVDVVQHVLRRVERDDAQSLLQRLVEKVRRSPIASISVALALLLGMTVGAAYAANRVPGLAVQVVDHLPGRVLPAQSRPPNPSGFTFAGSLYEQTTLDKVKGRMSFHVLTPTILPTGYRFAFALIPRGSTNHLLLVYQRPSAPTQSLVITESLASSRHGQVAFALRETTVEDVTVNGQPAVYLTGLPAELPGSETPFPNYADNELILASHGVEVRFIGQRIAGVGRSELERIAASLR